MQYWPWSRYRATAGFVEVNKWLTTDWIISGFSRKKIRSTQQYRTFVSEGRYQPKPWQGLKNQIYLGDGNFVDEMQCTIFPDTDLNEVTSSQKCQVAKPVAQHDNKYSDRNTAITEAS